jgi:hypothetical protein
MSKLSPASVERLTPASILCMRWLKVEVLVRATSPEMAPRYESPCRAGSNQEISGSQGIWFKELSGPRKTTDQTLNRLLPGGYKRLTKFWLTLLLEETLE